jgi:hypothetical protein
MSSSDKRIPAGVVSSALGWGHFRGVARASLRAAGRGVSRQRGGPRQRSWVG